MYIGMMSLMIGIPTRIGLPGVRKNSTMTMMIMLLTLTRDRQGRWRCRRRSRYDRGDSSNASRMTEKNRAARRHPAAGDGRKDGAEETSATRDHEVEMVPAEICAEGGELLSEVSVRAYHNIWPEYLPPAWIFPCSIEKTIESFLPG